MAVIETNRLSLRQVAAGDAAFILALMTSPPYLQFIGDRGVRTVDDARAYIREKYEPSYTRFGYGSYRVALKASDQPIGICGFVRRECLDHPDIGFAFMAEHWGQGYAYEAASAVLTYGFERLGLTTVLGITSPANDASQRLLQKLGMRYQKRVRVPPNDYDSLVFSIEANRRA